jgi:hypothetical protein
MTEEPAPETSADTPSADTRPADTASVAEPAAAPPVRRSSSLVFLLVLLDLVLLGGGLAYLWRFPPFSVEARLDALEQALAARPVAAPAAEDLTPLKARVEETAKRLSLLEQAPARGGEAAALAARLADDEARLEALAKQQAELAQAKPSAPAPAIGVDALLARLHDDEARLDALTQNSGAIARQVSSVAGQATLLARAHAAENALAAGRPLGDIPGAPPALARFAHTPPPTLAGLRAAFPAAAAAARAAAPSPMFGSRLMDWLGAVVTVRRGDQVVVGDTLASRLGAAKAALDDDDLAGALAVLAPIEGAPGAALAGWRQDAENLLAARRALDAMLAAG